MKPIPVVFHIGPVPIHTYGIGLAITFLFALWYMARRFERAGLSAAWLRRDGFWIIVAAIIGARVVHVLANASFYFSHPGEIVMIQHGGLSSFGGLLFAVPTGLWYMHRDCPELSLRRALDIAAPVLAASWAIGRLLGPQLMVAGGGHPTTAWYGLEYAGQAGKRVPVPIFQALQDGATYLILLAVERWVRERPDGVIVSLAAGLWGISRFVDEYFWLAVPPVWDAVEVMAIALSVTGWVSLGVITVGSRRRVPVKT